MGAALPQLHATIHGRVQGVSFRYYTRMQAQMLGITGWVRNLPDGKTVETLAFGSREALDQFLEWLHQGPSGAKVTHIDTEWDENPNLLRKFASFEIHHDDE
jgi:acylphosphatase